MPYKHWTLDDVPWDQFDRSKVNPHHLELAKAAAMVEFNSADYVAYLENVFDGDDTFLPEARRWGDEERQHGEALSRWSTLVDPDFDFDRRFQDFLDGFKIEIDVDESADAGGAADALVMGLGGPVAPSSVDEEMRRRRRRTAWIVAGSVIAAVVAGVVIGVVATEPWAPEEPTSWQGRWEP